MGIYCIMNIALFECAYLIRISEFVEEQMLGDAILPRGKEPYYLSLYQQ